MYNWTNDLPSGSIDTFLTVIKYFNVTHIDKPKKILEIGTFVGTSCIKLLELIPNSDATVIDKWENYVEGDVHILDNIEENNIVRFYYPFVRPCSIIMIGRDLIVYCICCFDH